MLFTLVPEVAFATESVAFGAEQVAELGIDGNLLINENRYDADLFTEEFLDANPFFYLEPCEQIFSTTTLDDMFLGNAVIVVFNKATSRENHDFTVADFSNVGAVYVEDLTRLSDKENTYAQTMWNAERQMYIAAINDVSRIGALHDQVSAEARMAVEAYESARAEAKENTFINFDEYRQSLLIRLDQNCKENVLKVIGQLRYREDILWVGPNYLAPLLEIEQDSIVEHNVPIRSRSFGNQWVVDLINL